MTTISSIRVNPRQSEFFKENLLFILSPLINVGELEKSLILIAPQAILGFMTRLAKLQELGLTPSNSLQFLTPDAS